MEKERPDALEVAAQAHEEGKAQEKGQPIRSFLRYLFTGALAVSLSSCASKGPAYEYLKISPKKSDVAKKKLDAIVESAQARIPIIENRTEPQAIEALETIENILREHGFVAYGVDEFEANLERGIALDCFDKTLIYLTVARERKLPLYAVELPGHIFISWRSSFEFNWETTSAVKKSKQDLLAQYPVDEKAIKQGVYMRALTSKEMEANMRSEMGLMLLSNREFEKAAKFYTKLTGMHPRGAHIIYNLGVAYARSSQPTKALSVYKRLVEIDPTHNVYYMLSSLIKEGSSRRICAKAEFEGGEAREECFAFVESQFQTTKGK